MKGPFSSLCHNVPSIMESILGPPISENRQITNLRDLRRKGYKMPNNSSGTVPGGVYPGAPAPHPQVGNIRLLSCLEGCTKGLRNYQYPLEVYLRYMTLELYLQRETILLGQYGMVDFLSYGSKLEASSTPSLPCRGLPREVPVRRAAAFGSNGGRVYKTGP